MDDAAETISNDDLIHSANRINQTLSTLSKFYISEVQDACLLIAEHVHSLSRGKLASHYALKTSMNIWHQCSLTPTLN